MLALCLLLSLSAAPSPAAAQDVTALIGVEEVEGHGTALESVRRAADSVVLLRQEGGSARALWVPRQSVLRLPSGSVTTPAKALRAGGTNLLDAALEQTLGVRPAHHVLLDRRGFRALVDAVGGVALPRGGSGVRRIDGQGAMAMVRALPGDPRADLARIRREMLLVRAFAAALPRSGVGGVLRAAALLPTVGWTDLSPLHAAELTFALAREPLRCAVLPGVVQGTGYRTAARAGAFARHHLGLDSEGQHKGRRRALPDARREIEVAAQGFGERLRDCEA